MTTAHAAIVDHLRTQPGHRTRLGELTVVAAIIAGVSREEAVAAVWDLVADGRADYGASAHVTLTDPS